ncbi:RapZ C-terminal domain-containing protein [Flavihumibacter profundi]|uniref:RapZ C-terminal domain-containing protein n=1 Tax=Flavihumibacter profundi TaxID=2716883 RepID=UPI001CC7321A|nr:RNase adapter RapZ [Flavihumibacter profundi]MBZ5857975.1 phosphotransferase [Flavihumibacter profundi]
MEQIISAIKALWQEWAGTEAKEVTILPQSGSDRIYYRVTGPDNKTVIATYNEHLKENQTFISFSKALQSKGCPVCNVLKVNVAGNIYLQEDFGDVSLLNLLEKHGYTDYIYGLFQQSLRELAHLQIIGGSAINYDDCLTTHEFGKQAIMSDLLYFKYYFLDTLKYPYDKQALLNDFEALSTYLTHTGNKHFMFRDFQSRNIMVKDDKVHFIDYQGGMRGALQYDVASLLWQARAELPDDWKNSLLTYYIDEAGKYLSHPLDAALFTAQYNGYVLIRLLQVLGAYGFRGFFQRKAQFLTSIPLALRNLKWFTDNRRMGISVPEFDRCLEFCTSAEIMARFEPLKADENTPLVVQIHSFSFRKGIPADSSGNGGGFVFDCRGILNPGRIEEFKTQTGRDKAVKDFLEQRTNMPDFLNSVFDMVDISVTDYIKRGFGSLQVNFGCTGGQHRSVYAADALARHLRNKFGVRIELKHIEQEAKNWINLTYKVE